jgi:hypothetical protein
MGNVIRPLSYGIDFTYYGGYMIKSCDNCFYGRRHIECPTDDDTVCGETYYPNLHKWKPLDDEQPVGVMLKDIWLDRRIKELVKGLHDSLFGDRTMTVELLMLWSEELDKRLSERYLNK